MFSFQPHETKTRLCVRDEILRQAAIGNHREAKGCRTTYACTHMSIMVGERDFKGAACAIRTVREIRVSLEIQMTDS